MGCGKKETSTEATTETTTTEATTEATTKATTEVQHEGVYNDLTGEWLQTGRKSTVVRSQLC